MSFRSKNKLLVESAIEVLEEEKPMTLRQLFYRLISAGHLQNSKSEYARLGGIMTRLREDGRVPRTWIVDHIRATLKPSSWSGLADFGESVQQCYRKDFWASLNDSIEVIVEKDAIAGTIQPVTREYDVPLRVCRGYSSVSFAGEIADEWRDIEKPIFVYYLGDFDPSGFDLERDLKEKLQRYSGKVIDSHLVTDSVNVQWQRLAVNAEDFDDWDLIRLPLKETDKRAAGFMRNHGDAGAEVDALPPTELRRRVKEAIESHIDQDEWARLQHIESLERDTMQRQVTKWKKLKLDKVSAGGCS